MIRHAVRSLEKSPLFTAIAVLSLGLALALNTTMFALSDAVLHPTIPYADPDRIVTVSFLGGFDRKHPVSFAERYRAVRDGLTTYDAIASYTLIPAMLQTATVAEDHWVAGVSPGFFGLLGVRPMIGRTFASGASRRDIARIVLHDAAVTALAGVGVGAFLALWMTRGISYSLSPARYAPVVALSAAECVLFGVALAACLAPVRRAMRADRVEVLRAG